MKRHFNMQCTSTAVPCWERCQMLLDKCTQMVTGDADSSLSPNITLFNFYELKCNVLTRVTISRQRVKLLDGAVIGARILTGGVFECDIAHHRFVAVLCILYKIRCNPMHPFNAALPGPCVPVWVTRSALVAHRYTYALAVP